VSDSPARSGTPPLGALFLSVFIGLMGFGVLLPVFPFWGRALGATPTTITLALGAYSLGQFIGAPLWGKVSDRYGRRPVLLWSLLGGAISYVLMTQADSIWLLGAARLFGGLMAGNIAVAFAYVGDVVPEAGRPKAMGMLGAAFGLGFIFGPAIGGLVAGDAPGMPEFARVAWTSAAITMVAVVGVFFQLPESLTRERRAATRAAGGGPSIGEVLRGKPAIGGLVLVVLLVIGSAAMMETTFALFADDRLGWSPRQVGLAFGLIGVISATIQGLGAAPLARRFGAGQVVLGGICAYALGLLGLAFANGGPAVLLALAVTATGVGMFNPAFQTLVAATTDDEDRGLINGLTQGGSAVGRIIGPAVSGAIFQGWGPAMPFVVGAAVMIIALAVEVVAGRRATRRRSREQIT
jgi:MFS transporter, DHA1 family, tetracycline resistance protein